MTREAQKIILAEYKGKREKVVLSTENLVDTYKIFVGGVVKGAWYKKLKKQLVVEFELHGDKKSKFVMFDVLKEQSNLNDFLTLEENVYDYFKEKLVLWLLLSFNLLKTC